MSLSDEIAFALELFGPLGGVSARRMFGGAGLYREGVMFGLLAQEAIYLRADAALGREMEEMGSEGRFAYAGPSGREAALPYWRLPDSATDDAEEALTLGRKAWAVACALKAHGGSRRRSGKGR